MVTNKNKNNKNKLSRSALMRPEGAYNNRKHLEILESALFSG